MSESANVKAIKDYAKTQPHRLKIVRVHSGGKKITGGYMKLADPGTSDFLCCLRGGRFLAVEAKKDAKAAKKRDNKGTFEAQAKFREEILALGGCAITVCSVQEFAAWLDAYFDESE